MVLTRSQYENMSKEEHIQELTDINSSFVSHINTKLSNLLQKSNEFTSKYDKVPSGLQRCKKCNSHLLTKIIQLERNAGTKLQCCRKGTIELNPVPADITEDVVEENICKELSLTGVNAVPNDLHTFYRIQRSDSVKVKFKCLKQKTLIMYKHKNLGIKSHELTNLSFSERLFVSEGMFCENQQLNYKC